MRKVIIAGNWKMNYTPTESIEVIKQLNSLSNETQHIELIIIPPFTSVYAIKDLLNQTKIKLGAQNVYHELTGAYTGEISIEMLKDCNCNYILVGHSERRQLFNETDEMINKKIKTIVSHQCTPIICVGETLEERNNNQTLTVIENQLSKALNHIESTENIIIAYEPVWAIGTGKVATPDQAQDTHKFIRHCLNERSENLAETTSILYGGSVKPSNIEGLITQPDIDGALVGGASLDASSFISIAKGCISYSS